MLAAFGSGGLISFIEEACATEKVIPANLIDRLGSTLDGSTDQEGINQLVSFKETSTDINVKGLGDRILKGFYSFIYGLRRWCLFDSIIEQFLNVD